MPVPTSMQDLSAAAASNSPQGSENVAPNLDNYLRSHAAILRQTYSLASSTIASASTVDIASADGESVQVTGSSTINSLGTGFAGCLREIRFSGSPTLVSSGSIAGLPGGENLVITAGEVAVFRCVGSGQWRMVSLSRVGTSGGGGGGGGGGGDYVLRSGDTMTGSLSVPGLSVAGNSVWHSGNFSPSSKQDSLGFTPVNKAGDTMTGSLSATGLSVGGNQVWHAGNSARVIVSATDPGGADGTVWVQP